MHRLPDSSNVDRKRRVKTRAARFGFTVFLGSIHFLVKWGLHLLILQGREWAQRNKSTGRACHIDNHFSLSSTWWTTHTSAFCFSHRLLFLNFLVPHFYCLNTDVISKTAFLASCYGGRHITLPPTLPPPQWNVLSSSAQVILFAQVGE